MGEGFSISNGFNIPEDVGGSAAFRDFMASMGQGGANSFVAGGPIISQIAEADLPPEVLLSPEALFAHLRNNLRDIDGQIRNQLELLQGRRDKISAALEVLTGLRTDMSTARELGDGEKGSGGDGIAITEENRQAYIDQLTAAGLTPSDAEGTVTAWGDHASADDFKVAIDSVNDSVNEMNGENEYQMLQVNELMSKRSNLIQLVSKILGNMNETASSIIQNMR